MATRCHAYAATNLGRRSPCWWSQSLDPEPCTNGIDILGTLRSQPRSADCGVWPLVVLRCAPFRHSVFAVCRSAVVDYAAATRPQQEPDLRGRRNRGGGSHKSARRPDRRGTRDQTRIRIASCDCRSRSAVALRSVALSRGAECRGELSRVQMGTSEKRCY